MFCLSPILPRCHTPCFPIPWYMTGTFFVSSAYPNQPVLTVRRGVDGSPVHLLRSPGVREAAREHFGCDTLEGALLEDGGGRGTVDAHWESRVFRDELMTGNVSSFHFRLKPQFEAANPETHSITAPLARLRHPPILNPSSRPPSYPPQPPS